MSARIIVRKFLDALICSISLLFCCHYLRPFFNHRIKLRYFCLFCACCNQNNKFVIWRSSCATTFSPDRTTSRTAAGMFHDHYLFRASNAIQLRVLQSEKKSIIYQKKIEHIFSTRLSLHWRVYFNWTTITIELLNAILEFPANYWDTRKILDEFNSLFLVFSISIWIILLLLSFSQQSLMERAQLLASAVLIDDATIDPAPFQLVNGTSLFKASVEKCSWLGSSTPPKIVPHTV